MSHLCYISRNYYGLSGAGNKAKTDIEHILRQMGARNLGLRTTFYDNKVVAFLLNLVGIVKMMFCIRRADVLVLQYPVKKYFSFICRVAHWRKAHVVVIIHDLMSLHRKRVTLATEIGRLSKGDVIIASNEKMQQWLSQQVIERPMTSLGLFDYLSLDSQKVSGTQGNQQSRKDNAGHPWSLVYAGALVMRKNSYLLELGQKAEQFVLHIYGNSAGLPGIEKAPRAVCYPFTPAEEFIRSADGDFGLVWDGDSLDTCQGDFGEYLRYNSPHKVSFYLRAGLPVIIWKEAAVASIIEQEGIGITISSMAELEQRLKSLTPDDLAQMHKNVARVNARLAAGEYFQEAMERAIQKV